MQSGNNLHRQFEIPYSDLKMNEKLGESKRKQLYSARALVLHAASTVHTGEGSFGTVFQGVFRNNAVAIKTMRVSKVNAKELKKFKDELVSCCAALARLVLPFNKRIGIFHRPSWHHSTTRTS